jgi:hypothetical protein
MLSDAFIIPTGKESCRKLKQFGAHHAIPENHNLWNQKDLDSNSNHISYYLGKLISVASFNFLILKCR